MGCRSISKPHFSEATTKIQNAQTRICSVSAYSLRQQTCCKANPNTLRQPRRLVYAAAVGGQEREAMGKRGEEWVVRMVDSM